MKICPDCGAPNLEHLKNCFNCSALLDIPSKQTSAFGIHEIGELLSLFDRCHLTYPGELKRGVHLVGVGKMPRGHDVPNFHEDELTLAYIPFTEEPKANEISVQELRMHDNNLFFSGHHEADILVTNHRIFYLPRDDVRPFYLGYNDIYGVFRRGSPDSDKLILGISTMQEMIYELYFTTPPNSHFFKAMGELCVKAMTRKWY